MTKASLIKEIEFDGKYEAVKIDAKGNVTGRVVGEPVRYTSSTNTGGRRFIGYDTELLAALMEAGQVSEEVGNAYNFI